MMIEWCKCRSKEGEEEVGRIEAEIKELERQRDNELGDQVSDKEAVLQEKEKKEAKVSSALKTLKDNVKQEGKKKAQIEKSVSAQTKAKTTVKSRYPKLAMA